MPAKAQRIRRSPEAAREEIIDATESALNDMSFGELTVDLIMQRTDMTRSSFYHYFSGLDELVLGFLDRVEKEIHGAVDELLDGDGTEDYRGATQRHLTDMFVLTEKHYTAFRALAQASNKNQIVQEQWRARLIDNFSHMTAAFIRRQCALGRSRVTDPDRLARALNLLNNALMNDNIQRAEPDDPIEVGQVSAEIWNKMIFDN